MRSATIVGVHPVEADEPCHLIELAVCDPGGDFNMDDVTQVEAGTDIRQAAYEERFLDTQSLHPLPETSHQRPDRKEYRVAFFFHYLDLARPLETSFGPLALPRPSPRPAHLVFMEWLPPR